MSDPVRFYFSEVIHRRFATVAHRLHYRVAYLLLDLDRMAEAGGRTGLLGIGRKGIMSFRAADHGDGVSEDLAAWVRGYLKGCGVVEDAARIELLTMPRMFGYVFNPISVYFIRDGAGDLHHVFYEVNNTFGDRHFYLCAAGRDGKVLRHGAGKALYVSPFFDESGGYRFTVRPPSLEASGEPMALSIRYDDAAGNKRLTAHLTGRPAAVTRRSALRVLFAYPLMTLGVIAGIHWEALKLWLKGVRLRPRAAAGPSAAAGRQAQG